MFAQRVLFKRETSCVDNIILFHWHPNPDAFVICTYSVHEIHRKVLSSISYQFVSLLLLVVVS